MIISFQGQESVRITQGDLSIAVNPKAKSATDIVLFSSNALKSETKEGAFVINGPGEYEVKDVVIRGFLSQADGKIVTLYHISFEGMTLGYLGALSAEALSSEALEALENSDILFVPIGGEGVLDAAAAYKLGVSLEPSVIIPIHFGEVGEKDALKKFLKEGGDEEVKPVDKFVVKKKDLEGKEGEIVVLKEE